ncbi:MAG: GHKL domain-containing protein, partial [Lachnospiraceae bacterium]|nr:GHKL domain-containing protein [Lachnospiraceae bacterium]
LKTPIALIQGYAEGLKEGISDDPESRNYYCEVIADEAAKMNELVKELMSLNELEMGDKTVQIERFNINEMILNQIQAMKVLAEQKGVVIVYEPFDYSIWSDEFKIEEVFRNYLSNAIHHVDKDDNGKKEIVIYTVESGDMLRVIVFNTGETIPEESVGKIWDKFYKVDKARTREYGGSGVGLSIVKATMELLGQNYGFDNKENGVEFYFEVQLK